VKESVLDLSVSVAGIQLDHPVMNGAGSCKTMEDVKMLSRLPVSAIMVGSVTWEERAGNSGDVFWTSSPHFFYSLNSLGLPNRGCRYYREVLPEMVRIAHDCGKPLFVSVAGFSAREYADLARNMFEAGSDLVELNLGCPNAYTAGGVQHQIASFDPIQVSRILQAVHFEVGPEAKVAVKLSPYADPIMIPSVTRAISSWQMVKAVTTMNTFPNATYLEEGRHVTSSANGLAGLAGPAILPIGLGQVQQLRELLSKDVIGVGGVGSGQAVRDYQRVGATAVQVTSAYLSRGGDIFRQILEELVTPEAVSA
jgi:dihydroorotate dehydrogenase (fumarate)